MSAEPIARGEGAGISDEWVVDHFDIHAPELGADLHRTLARARELCPIARSDVYEGGYWVATRYEDVLRIAQDWETWSNQLGITVGPDTGEGLESMVIPPVTVDPPLQRTFKRLINRYFTPAAVAPWEDATRALVTRLIDGFIERGECDFMEAFARPLPGLAFFDLALHAPAEDLEQVNDWATLASLPTERSRRTHGSRSAPGSPSSSPAGARRSRAATWSTPCWRPRSTAARSTTSRPSAA